MTSSPNDVDELHSAHFATLDGGVKVRKLPKKSTLWIWYDFDIRLPISKVLTFLFFLIFQVSWPKQTKSEQSYP